MKIKGTLYPILRIIIVALMGIFLWGCGTQQVAPSKTANQLHYLALGDSYTIGESVAASDRWPVQLSQHLRSAGVDIADPVIIAQTGWTTDELQVGIQRVKPTGPFDLVSLLIGVNNQYRGQDLDTYRRDLEALLQQAVDFAGGNLAQVLVLSIPDWGVTPFATGLDRDQIGEQIDRFNAVNREEAEGMGVQYVDITPESRQALEDPDLVAADGLHPSAQMYQDWVDLALPHALRALETS